VIEGEEEVRGGKKTGTGFFLPFTASLACWPRCCFERRGKKEKKRRVEKEGRRT